MAIAAGTSIGPYEIVSTLGEGGMGEVYRVTDTRLRRQVAIKVLPPGFAQDPERVARFHREAQVLAALNHPNIAGIYGLEQAGGDLALALELVDGEDLADRLTRRGSIPIDEAIPLAAQIAAGLEAAHERGVVHRDLIQLPDETWLSFAESHLPDRAGSDEGDGRTVGREEDPSAGALHHGHLEAVQRT